jgi:hypothetical protein
LDTEDIVVIVEHLAGRGAAADAESISEDEIEGDEE